MRAISVSAVLLLLVLCTSSGFALGQKQYVAFSEEPGAFPLVNRGGAAPILVDKNDWAGVTRAAHDLQADVERVTKNRPEFQTGSTASAAHAVVVGTLGRSQLIDQLAREGRIDAAQLSGKWEKFLVQVVEKPWPGTDSALVIAGSDKRGTIYGLYDLSEQIGVSPWYWWADVPVRRHEALYVLPGIYTDGEPAVKYRGIFLNDEAPALSGWAKEKFGGLNHMFYEHVFELLLRLKGNYLWPAMWNNAFNEDDPANPKLADEYGIVMGTSHHEPMLRAQQEWKRHGHGPWDYSLNADVLRAFWAEGVERNKRYESIVTIGMRGDGDMPMSEESNVALLQKIVADQRKILAEHVNPDVTKVPQLWALYKEVQDYFEKGMRVPADVTLLWCDDNWGNIRRLPTAAERNRAGGAGVYYHFDYVGGPRNYKWINTVPITKVQEQMNLAWEYGADRIWIVNVGDLKPMEFPIEFFLNFAWSPKRWPAEKLNDYTRAWTGREFGAAHAAEIASLISEYTKLNGLRKPELLEPTTYSLLNYNEAERQVERWENLAHRAEAVAAALPAESQDAFFELVQHPILAAGIVNKLYVTVGQNRLYALQGRASANLAATQARELFLRDEQLTHRYNDELGGGRWRHMMDQTHLGYTYWQQPPANVMPGVQEVQVRDVAEMAVSVEGSPAAWPGYDPRHSEPTLPILTSTENVARHFDVFNRGRKPFDFTVESNEPWLKISPRSGSAGADTRVTVEADWSKVPADAKEATLTVRGAGETVSLRVPVRKVDVSAIPAGVFVETEKYVAIEAEHFSRAVNAAGITWKLLPDFGRTLSGVTPMPVTAPSQTPGGGSPRLEYEFTSELSGPIVVQTVFAPTLNFQPGRGLRCAISIDDAAPQEIDIAPRKLQDWEQAVSDAARVLSTNHVLAKPGRHVLKFWMIDPGVVLERLVVDFGGVRPSYLGPPESFRGGPVAR
ncbi:MAG TPA: glycosyl hydrolase 115 family protein [Opitutaceae bacterium]|nr:glycosyl hydrolase 115 family protein [Opitutaceae bacterium]